MRGFPRSWRMVSLRVLCRATSNGWQWGSDPRNPRGLSLISPRGTVFETRKDAGTRLRVRRYVAAMFFPDVA